MNSLKVYIFSLLLFFVLVSKAQLANDDYECITTRANANLSVFDNDIFESLDDYDISIVISPAFGTAELKINSGNPRIQYKRTSFIGVGDTLVYTLTDIISGEVDSATVYISFRGEADWDGLPSEICQSEEGIDLTSLTTTGGIWILDNDTVTSIVPKDLTATDYEIVYVVGVEECVATDISSFTIVDSVNASWSGLDAVYCTTNSDIDLSTDLRIVTAVSAGVPSWEINGVLSSVLDFSVYPLDTEQEVKYVVENGVCKDSLSRDFIVKSSQAADWDSLPSEICQSEEVIDLTSLTTTGGIWILGNDTVTSIAPKDLPARAYEIVYVVGSEECVATDTSIFTIVDSVNASWSGLDAVYCTTNSDIDLSTDLRIVTAVSAGVPSWEINGVLSSVLDFSIYPLDTEQEVKYIVENGVCKDSLSRDFIVNEMQNATWDHFEDSLFCKYAESISLNTLNGRLQSSTVNGSWFLDNDELTDSLIFRNLDLGRDYQLIFKSGTTTSCESADSQLIIINEGDSFETIMNSTCSNTIVFDVTKSLNTLWTSLSENLVIEEYSDSIAFVNASYGNSAVRFIEIEGHKCPIVKDYNLYFEQQAEPINLGSDINLKNGVSSFQIDAGSIPTGYVGKWYFDPTTLSVSNELNPAIEVEVLKSDTAELIWQLESSVCLLVSDTIKVSKQQFLVSGGISPNDDGLNDYFTVLNAPEGKVSVYIINRWGQVVFESRDYKNDWKGTNQNDKILPADTYYYTLDFENGTTAKGKLIIRK